MPEGSEEENQQSSEEISEVKDQEEGTVEKIEDALSQNKETKNLQKSDWEDIIFEFPRPQIRFGKGTARFLPDAVFELMDPLMPHLLKSKIEKPKVLIVIGGESLKKSGNLEDILESCKNRQLETELYSAGSGEPTTNIVNNGVKFAKSVDPEFVVGIGGGSVLDTAKAIAGIYTNGGKVQDYHDGKEFKNPGLPFIAIPTTAGTGSEITNNAVITDPERGFKKSIRGKHLIANYILLDPGLTLSCPPDITAYSGSDALVQAIEAYVSKGSHPLSDIYAMQAVVLLAGNLKDVYENGKDFEARAQMLLGSYFAGIAFSNVKLGLVHALAHPIGYRYKIPHGKICASLLPWVIEYNSEERADKYAKLAMTLNRNDFFNTYEPEASDEDNTRRLIGMLKELISSVNIPIRLEELGIEKEDLDWIVARVVRTKGGSYEANPREPDRESLKKLLSDAY